MLYYWFIIFVFVSANTPNIACKELKNATEKTILYSRIPRIQVKNEGLTRDEDQLLEPIPNSKKYTKFYPSDSDRYSYKNNPKTNHLSLIGQSKIAPRPVQALNSLHRLQPEERNPKVFDQGIGNSMLMESTVHHFDPIRNAAAVFNSYGSEQQGLAYHLNSLVGREDGHGALKAFGIGVAVGLGSIGILSGFLKLLILPLIFGSLVSLLLLFSPVPVITTGRNTAPLIDEKFKEKKTMDVLAKNIADARKMRA